MTTPWRFKVWRLAWARATSLAIGGWRRLWWRLWWDLRIPAPLPKIRIIHPPVAPKLLHWPARVWRRTQRQGSHWCDAPASEPWCEAFDDVTCPVCRKLGLPYYLQYKMNTR
jgi:hypothetical protein